MRRRKDRLCHGCHAAPPRPDRSTCAPCAKRRSDAEKARRAQCRRLGLCAWGTGGCGHRAAKGRRMCRPHLAYHAAAFRARKAPPEAATSA